jgi:hypothetical protein
MSSLPSLSCEHFSKGQTTALVAVIDGLEPESTSVFWTKGRAAPWILLPPPWLTALRRRLGRRLLFIDGREPESTSMFWIKGALRPDLPSIILGSQHCFGRRHGS